MLVLEGFLTTFQGSAQPHSLSRELSMSVGAQQQWEEERWDKRETKEQLEEKVLRDTKRPVGRVSLGNEPPSHYKTLGKEDR